MIVGRLKILCAACLIQTDCFPVQFDIGKDGACWTCPNCSNRFLLARTIEHQDNENSVQVVDARGANT